MGARDFGRGARRCAKLGAAVLATVPLSLGGCVSLVPVHDGPVTITRTLSVGVYHSCLSYGIGVMLCEHIRFDPATCAMVLIFDKAPSQPQENVLRKLGQEVRAMCLSDKEPTP